MKLLLLLLLHLLLLVVPASASAYEVYDITCENVVSIRIERLKDTVGNITSLGDYHTVYFELTPHAAEAFVRLRDASPMIPIMFREKLYPLENLRIISHRRPIALRAFALTAHGDHGITFIAVKEHDAFDLARTVCPALTPAKVLVDGRLVDPDPANPPVPQVTFPPTGDLPYELSCDNVASVDIVRHTEDDFPGVRTPEGSVHLVFFALKPAAADLFQPILDESRKLTPRPGAPGEFTHRKIAVTTGGQPLPSDIPEIEAHSGRTVNTYIFREADARATARAVCPSAPVRLFTPPNPIRR